MNKEIETLICCGQELKHNSSLEDGKGKYRIIFYTCEKCRKYIKLYPNHEQSQKLDELAEEKALTEFLIKQLRQRGYHAIKDTEYNHHGEILLRELQDDLSSLEMKILGEVKGNKTIIYLQPESCCSLADEYERDPIKLPLIQLPANTKDIKYFDYFPNCWKHPTFGFEKGEPWDGNLKDIWRNRDKSSHSGTYFPKAKTELMEELKNKGFLWKGGETDDNYLKAICPRCNWTYSYELTEKYMKVEEQEEIAKAIKNHEC